MFLVNQKAQGIDNLIDELNDIDLDLLEIDDLKDVCNQMESIFDTIITEEG
jgi:hypothetical protein